VSARMRRLGDCCEVVSGATPRTDNDAYWGGEIRWATPKDVSGLNSSTLYETPDKLTEAGYRSCSTKLVPPGSVLVSSRAPIGLVAIAGVKMCTNQGFKTLVPGPELSSSYLYHCMKANADRLASLGNGATFKEVSKSTVENFEIPVPQLEAQIRIATILDRVESLRRKRQEAIRLADELLRAVFIDMFGGLDKASNPQVELADLVTLDAPMVDPTSTEFADMLHVGPDRIEKGNGQLLACETARAEGLTSKKFLFDERHVLYSKIRPALKKCALAEFRGLCSADMYPVRTSGNKVTREFIWGLLLSDAFDRYVGTLPDRANIPKLNREELNAFQFRLPSIETQRKYSAIVQRTTALRRQHKTFMQQANTLPASLGFFN
jgi:type I restriction enzyme S subunit